MLANKIEDMEVRHFSVVGGGNPVVKVYQRKLGVPVLSLAKVTESWYCPRTTGEIYVSLPSMDRDWSDTHDSSHPSKDITVLVEGKRQLAGVEEVAFCYDRGFTYCMACVDDEEDLDLTVFDKKEPVASRLTLDPMEFGGVAGYSLALELGLDTVTVVHGRVRYLDYKSRDDELSRASNLQSIGEVDAGVEATFIKECRPEFLAQSEYRFLFLCDRKGLTATKVPIHCVIKDGDDNEVWLWETI